MIIRESIEFKRGQASKKALDVGRFHDDPNLRWFHDEALERGYKETTPENYPTDPDINELILLGNYDRGNINLRLYTSIDNMNTSDYNYNSFYIYSTIGDNIVDEPFGEWASNDYWWDRVETLEKEAFNEN